MPGRVGHMHCQHGRAMPIPEVRQATVCFHMVANFYSLVTAVPSRTFRP